MKEKFYAEAFGEYMKRLQPYCKLQLTEAPEQRLSESPSPKELEKALDREAEDILAAHLPELAGAGAEAVGAAGYAYPVTASLEERCWFPTKAYGDFALPAGQYTALRLEIGAGAGQNWWCVVFPPLCLAPTGGTWAETAAQAGLTEQEAALVTGGSDGYEIRFRALELVEQFRRWLEG